MSLNKLSRIPALGLLALALAFAGSGCATIIKGKEQDVSFQSVPEGATVTVNGKAIGKTPITYKVQKEKKIVAEVSLEGYKTTSVDLTVELEPWFWGNILIGGLIGSTVDGVSGAMHKVAPDTYSVTLERIASNRVERDTEIAREDRIRLYLILARDQIAMDADRGQGQHLDTLLAALEVPPGDREAAVSRIRDAGHSAHDAGTFAETVLKGFNRA